MCMEENFASIFNSVCLLELLFLCDQGVIEILLLMLNPVVLSASPLTFHHNQEAK